MIRDEKSLQSFARDFAISKTDETISDELAIELVKNLGGCIQGYKEVIKNASVNENLKDKKKKHSRGLRFVLDLLKDTPFTQVSLERYELLRAIANGERVSVNSTSQAFFLLSKHGQYSEFLGIHPEGYLVFALPMTEFCLRDIEPEMWLIPLVQETYKSVLRKSLDIVKGRQFSAAALERYDLLVSIYNGEKITDRTSPAARYLLSRRDGYNPLLSCKEPDGQLVFATPLIGRALEDIDYEVGWAAFWIFLRASKLKRVVKQGEFCE